MHQNEGKRAEGNKKLEEGSRVAVVEPKIEPKGSYWLSGLFFGLCFPFLEVLLRLGDSKTEFLSSGLLRAVLAGAAAGMLVWLIGTLIPKKGISRFLTGTVLLLFAVVFIAEQCCRAFFGTYFQLSFMLGMSGQVAGDFMGSALEVIWKNLWFFPLALLPLLLFVIFRKHLLPKRKLHMTAPAIQVLLLVIFQCVTLILCKFGGDVSYYTWDYNANSAVPRFGLITTLRLEGQYALFGLPEEEMTFEPVVPPAGSTPEEPAPPDENEPEEPEQPVVYGDNVMNIDFAGLAAQSSDRMKNMDRYFSAQTPTKENAYTGMFEGKNLILFTAESFATPAIDEKLTPTLYRLANTGFVFPNFYQPDWTQSTTGGEFAVMTGIIPTWVNGKTSFSASVGKAMPFALGWQFADLGYDVKAYHNNTYNYYGRDKTHPNLGYNYAGIGNGLELAHPDLWPTSDLEMMQATLDESIQSYVNEGKKFHNYYMTVSGHCNYNFSNDMAEKNEAAVAGVSGSEQVRAYKACQLELEYALKYTVDALEQAGIADDTVIVLTGDHYPYAMSEGEVDYYNELTGRNDTPKLTSRYENTLILWSGCMEEPVVVEAPGCAVDIVPTLSNLFGLEYDSRLLSGRDLLAPDVPVGQYGTDMHLAVFADSGFGNSWVSNAGTYEASTRTFTPNPGVQVGEDYVQQVNQIVSDRYSFAKHLIGEDYYRHLFPDAP